MIKSNWHTTIQNSFREQGCQTEKIISQTQNKNYRIADIMNQRTVLEVQHSRISKNEVDSRNYDYTKRGYYIFWIIDGSAFNIEESRENAFLITLTFPWNHLDHIFSSCKILFASCKYMGKEYIMKFSPNSVRKELIYVSEYFLLEDFIRSFRENCTKLFDPIIENIPCRLIIKQEPPGSGKTYGMVHKIINSLNDGNEEFQPYSTFIILTKPHSAKNVVQREFKDQLDRFNIYYEEGEYNNAPWFLLISHNQKKLIILATGDSFVHAIGERDNNSLDMFQGICKKIEQKGPTRLGRDGSLRFKSHPMKVNARSLIIMDEATKFTTVYAFALGKLMLCCLCDAYIIGDKLQSIEYDNNLFTYLMDVENPFPHVQRYVRNENVIRRGGKNLVHFVTTVVGEKTYAENNLPVPISCKDNTIKRDNEGEIEIMFLKNITHDADESSIQKIVEKIRKEMHRLCLLPNDILIILPFVTNNPFGDFLRDKLDDFLLSILENPYYRTIMLNSPYKDKAREYFQNFDENKEQKKEYKQKYERNKNSYQWLAYFHRSETGKPIDTSKSDQAVRMVSIHASQGDGRRLAITCQLSEAALKIFTKGNKNLQYNSLIQVSISRAKTKQIVILEKDKNDDIIRRFRPFCEAKQVVQLKPFLNLTNTFYIGKPLFENYGNENKEWITSYHLEHGGGQGILKLV